MLEKLSVALSEAKQDSLLRFAQDDTYFEGHARLDRPPVSPHTAIVAGFIISALGGSRVQMGGPTGPFVVIAYGIVQKYGIDGLTVACAMCSRSISTAMHVLSDVVHRSRRDGTTGMFLGIHMQSLVVLTGRRGWMKS